MTYDAVERREVDRYLELVPEHVRDRVTTLIGSSLDGPRAEREVDLLYIDTSHGRADTIREFEQWRTALAAGAVVVFDDYSHPGFPGVEQAVRDLALTGVERQGMFIHRPSAGGPEPAPPGRPRPSAPRTSSR